MQHTSQGTEKQVDKLPIFQYDILNDEELLSPANPRLQKRRWFIIISIVLLIVVIAGASFVLYSRRSRVTYQYQRISQGDLSLTTTATGVVQSKVYDIDFAISGKIAEIDVQTDQQVKAGQVLARLDTVGLQDVANQAQDALTQAQNSANPDAIQSAQDQLATAQHNLANATLVAPDASTVVAINDSVGSVPNPTAHSFIQLAVLSSSQVLVHVNESDVGLVAQGDNVQFTVSAYGSRLFHGTVSSVSPLGQTVSGVVTFPTIVNIDTSDLQEANLFSGMTANVFISTVQRSHVDLLPTKAISFAQKAAAQGLITHRQAELASTSAQQMLSRFLQSTGPKAWLDNPTPLYVLERVNGQWVVKPVLLGLTDGTSYEILVGLTTEDTVVIDDQGRTTAVGNSGLFGGAGDRSTY